MSKAVFARVVAAVATPFLSDDRVDLGRLLAHCRWLLTEGCDGLLLFGSTGESASLTLDERHRIIDHLAGNGIPAAKLLIGSGCCALEDTLELTRHANEAGCGGVLVVPPFFFKHIADEGLLRYYSELIERTADNRLALYLYHFPQTSMVPISLELTRDLVTRYPGVIRGYKDSSGDWANTEKFLKAFPDLDIYSSTEARIADVLRLGGAGCVSATANVQPRAIRKLVEAAGTDAETALQKDVAACRNAFQGLPVVPAVKAALESLHNDSAWSLMRAPLTPLDPAARTTLLSAIGL
jgi:4-hydroxy-tetrahydrodipicolinate synthase